MSAELQATTTPNSSNLPTCKQSHVLDLLDVGTIVASTLKMEKAQRMAEFFSLLGDPNRLRILSVLATQELCVCDLANILEMSESAISHQLRTLRAMRLVGYKKIGRRVFYRLLDDHVLGLYNSVAEHLDESD